MKWLDDKQILSASGLHTPYVASDPMLSGITGMSVMTHRLYNGMAGAHKINDQFVCALFVDQLPVDPNVNGLLSSGSDVGVLTHVQSGFQAWQFDLSLQMNELHGQLAKVVVFIEWKPHSLEAALLFHDKLISRTMPAETWLIGSDYEKQSYARFMLDAGLSSLALPYFTYGKVAESVKQMNKPMVLPEGPGSAMVCTEIDWFTTED